MVPTTVNMLCLNKVVISLVVISLDDIPLGYLTADENNTMIVTDYKDGNKFAIPSCKVITVVKGDFNKLIVDILFSELISGVYFMNLFPNHFYMVFYIIFCH